VTYARVSYNQPNILKLELSKGFDVETELSATTADEDSTETSYEVDFALVLARMINAAREDPAHLRSTIYELARVKLRKETMRGDAAQEKRLLRALEVATQEVEIFSKQEESKTIVDFLSLERFMKYSSLLIFKLSVGLALLLTGSASRADEYLLRSSVGQCEYNYITAKSIRQTKCSAKALLVNSQTSELFSCSAVVEGDQYVAPSVAETTPDVLNCTLIGQPYLAKGNYAIELADDTAKADKTLNRIHGSFSWFNAFWVYSRQTADLKFCTALLANAGTNHQVNCSSKINWVR